MVALLLALSRVQSSRNLRSPYVTQHFKMATLRTSGFQCMLAVDPTFTQKAFRKGRTFMAALRAGADAFTQFKEVANIKKERYVSHRRAPPSQYN